MTLRRTLPALVGAALVALVAAGCGDSADAANPADTGEQTVVTSFYPIEFATSQIVGNTATVSVLTQPGAEPHELELGAQDIAAMSRAKLVIYADGFQRAVDEAMAQVDPGQVLDVADAADLVPSGAEFGDQPAQQNDASDHAGDDPHFWLDPQRYAAVAAAIGARLAANDPAHAAVYGANTQVFIDRLTRLDQNFRTALSSCVNRTIVTSHSAFGYLARRYALKQHGITGLSPEAEPSAAGLKAITDLVRREHITTVYQETLVEADFARTVANSTGVSVATLDPIEGITSTSAGSDYFAVMRSNLAALQKGQGCT